MNPNLENMIHSLTHNFWLKFIALVLAVLTWFYVAAQVGK